MRRASAIAFNHSNAALITAWVSTVAIDGSACIRLIKSTVWICGFHGVAVLGTDTISNWLKQGLIIVCSKSCRLVILDQSTFSTTFTSTSYLQCLRCFHLFHKWKEPSVTHQEDPCTYSLAHDFQTLSRCLHLQCFF